MAFPVRGYITGSSWAEYKQKGTVHGLPQPTGLEQCQAFPGGPIYTPSSKVLHGYLNIARPCNNH
jgi:phosphoribosylaminoimidazole-succinocarboxamide synthase